MTLFRADVSAVHDRAFGFHADNCAPGLLALLAPVRERGGLVLEIGCGSGLLTRHLLDAGHRVIASDASEDMLAIARRKLPDAEEIRRIALPDDPLPAADAIVGVGHPLSYLPDHADVRASLAALAGALRPGGILAVDLCDLGWHAANLGRPASSRLAEDWAMITTFHAPAEDRFAFELTVFTRNEDGTWHRDDERHDLVLTDTAQIPSWFPDIDVTVGDSFGGEKLPAGLATVVMRR